MGSCRGLMSPQSPPVVPSKRQWRHKHLEQNEKVLPFLDCTTASVFAATATYGTCPQEPRRLKGPEGAIPNRVHTISPNPQHWASNYPALEADGGMLKKASTSTSASTSHLLSVSLSPPAAFSDPHHRCNTPMTSRTLPCLLHFPTLPLPSLAPLPHGPASFI